MELNSFLFPNGQIQYGVFSVIRAKEDGEAQQDAPSARQIRRNQEKHAQRPYSYLGR